MEIKNELIILIELESLLEYLRVLQRWENLLHV